MATAERRYSGPKVAELLGLTCPEFFFILSEFLKEQQDWTEDAGNVVLTESGLQGVLDRVRESSGPLPPDLDFASCLVTTAKPAKREAEPPLVALVVKTVLPNSRLLLAHDPAGNVVTVEVRQNRNFRPKMTLEGRVVRAGRYAMVGPLPRRPGRY